MSKEEAQGTKKNTLDYYGKYEKITTDFPNVIECQFIEEDGKRIAKFILCFYDETLYEMVE